MDPSPITSCSGASDARAVGSGPASEHSARPALRSVFQWGRPSLQSALVCCTSTKTTSSAFLVLTLYGERLQLANRLVRAVRVSSRPTGSEATRCSLSLLAVK